MKLLTFKTTGAVAIAMALAVSLLCASCQGRTMDNMVPTGDTVEVTPDTIQTETTASTFSPQDSI